MAALRTIGWEVIEALWYVWLPILWAIKKLQPTLRRHFH